MPDPTPEQALTAFWSTFLGCDEQFLFSSQVVVIPRFVDDEYEGIYLLRRPEACLVAVMSREPGELVREVMQAVGRLRPAEVFEPRFWTAFFGDRIRRIDGPAFIGYLDPSTFTPSGSNAGTIRALEPKRRSDSEAIRKLFGACDIEDWEHGGLDLDGEDLVGWFAEGELLAAAGFERWSDRLAHLGVAVHPAHRQQGIGTAVLSAACERAMEDGRVPQIRALRTSRAAIGLAASLGFQPWGDSLVATFREPGAETPENAE